MGLFHKVYSRAVPAPESPTFGIPFALSWGRCRKTKWGGRVRSSIAHACARGRRRSRATWSNGGRARACEHGDVPLLLLSVLPSNIRPRLVATICTLCPTPALTRQGCKHGPSALPNTCQNAPLLFAFAASILCDDPTNKRLQHMDGWL